MKNNSLPISNDWLLTGASATGLSHTEKDLPCQDGYIYKMLNEFWGIAIVSDGAGSCVNSHFGSSLVVCESVTVFETLLHTQDWYINRLTPSPENWRNLAINAMSYVFEKLHEYSVQYNMPFPSLASTVIITVFSESCLLTANIGDGRLAYKNGSEDWQAGITPFKGETVGETVFITSSSALANNLKYFETQVFDQPVTAFALLSDGAEQISFTVYRPDETGFFSDPNLPFSLFFNSICQTLESFFEQGYSACEISEKFKNFLENGHPILVEEHDDKTMVIGIKKRRK
jgi:hypothetical protein